MACVACGTWCRPRLCARCRAGLRPGGDRLVGRGLVVRAALLHTGTARVLVHRLKYQGLAAAAVPLAEAMAPLLEPLPPALVPVPRALARRWRYGVDPGPELAAVLGALCGIPVLPALGPGWWHRRRAGGGGIRRGTPSFRARLPVPGGSLLVDDVVTTGSTLAAAAGALGGTGGAITATAAPSVGFPLGRPSAGGGSAPGLAGSAPACALPPGPARRRPRR